MAYADNETMEREWNGKACPTCGGLAPALVEAALFRMVGEPERPALIHGWEAGYYGPNTFNCHPSYFATPEKTKVWELGNAKGKSDRGKISGHAKCSDHETADNAQTEQ